MPDETTTAETPLPNPIADQSQASGEKGKSVEDEASFIWSDAEPPQCPVETGDDDPPNPRIEQMALAERRSEALKPLAGAIQDLYSEEPAKASARDKLERDYREAYEAKPKGLRERYDAAETNFSRAATDMDKKLEDWITKWLCGDKSALLALFAQRKQVQKRLEARGGPREKMREQAAETAAHWQKRYGEWSAPHATIAKLLGEYESEINKINSQINNGEDADLAIYRFWFEIAPKHFQLRKDPVARKYPRAEQIEKKLANFPEFANFLKSGPDRRDGSVFLIAPAKRPQPGMPEDPGKWPIHRRRRIALLVWELAAEALAKRENDYRLRPDDGQALKKRRDALVASRRTDVEGLLKEPAV